MGASWSSTKRYINILPSNAVRLQNKKPFLPYEKLLFKLANNKNEWEHVVKFLQPFQIGKKFSMFIAGGYAAFRDGRTTKFNDIDIFLYAKSDEIEQSDDFINIIKNACCHPNNSWFTTISYKECDQNSIVFTSKETRFQVIIKKKLPPSLNRHIEKDVAAWVLYQFDLQICQCAILPNKDFIIIHSCQNENISESKKQRQIKYDKRKQKCWTSVY